MGENRHTEFEGLRALAQQYLESPLSVPGTPQLVPCQPLIRLWVYPSFSAHIAWHIFSLRRMGNESLIVRRVMWEQADDANRLLVDPLRGLREGFSAAPTIEIRDRLLNADELGQRLEQLKKIYIPVWTGHKSIGVDGVVTGVELAYGRVLVEWWSAYAPELGELVSWAEQARAWLEDVCVSQDAT